MREANLTPTVPEGGKLEDCPAFPHYQDGSFDEAGYLHGLAQYLQISDADALRAHNGILSRPTEGTGEIVQKIEVKGLTTACLSNTNALHWEVLTDPNRYPNIASLNVKAASQIIGISKPDPRIYQEFEAMVQANGSEIVFFEDSPANVEAALKLGWNAVLIDPAGSQKDQITSALSNYQIHL